MADWVRQQMEGWGRWPVVTAEVSRPETQAELARAVAESNGEGLLAYGLGRSYGDTALLPEGRMVVTSRLDRMLAFDAETGWLTAEAGVSIEEILAVFVPRGFFPSVTPGTKFVTLGGALGCDVHGKSHHVDGSFSNNIRSFELLLSSGEVVHVTRETHPELFKATAGGLGLTGIVLSMEFKLNPIANAMIEMESVRVESLDHFFEVSGESGAFTHHMGWIDCTTRGKAMGRGIFMRGRHAAAGADARPDFVARVKDVAHPLLSMPINGPGWLLNTATIKAFNEVYFRRHAKGMVSSVVHYDPFFYPLDAVRGWNKIYGKRGFLQYQMVLPHERDHRAIRAILDAITASGMGSFLAVIKEFGSQDNGWLSFPRPGLTLALDFPNHGAPLLALLERLDAITIEAGGRVYLGKDARLSRANFQRMYPEWEAWKAARDAADPKGLFKSSMGERLGLVTPRVGRGQA